jgi:hypothetical protein
VTPTTIRAELATAVRAVNAGLSRLPAPVRGQIDPYDGFDQAAILTEDRDRAMQTIDAWRTEQLARIEQARAEAGRDGPRSRAVEAGGRRCPVCGEGMEGRRANAEVCGTECRRIRNRVQRLCAGEVDGPYTNLFDYGPALGKRANRARATT